MKTTTRQTKHISERAFTIIEVLIVVIILGLLLAMGLAKYQGYQAQKAYPNLPMDKALERWRIDKERQANLPDGAVASARPGEKVSLEKAASEEAKTKTEFEEEEEWLGQAMAKRTRLQLVSVAKIERFNWSAEAHGNGIVFVDVTGTTSVGDDVARALSSFLGMIESHKVGVVMVIPSSNSAGLLLRLGYQENKTSESRAGATTTTPVERGSR